MSKELDRLFRAAEKIVKAAGDHRLEERTYEVHKAILQDLVDLKDGETVNLVDVADALEEAADTWDARTEYRARSDVSLNPRSTLVVVDPSLF